MPIFFLSSCGYKLVEGDKGQITFHVPKIQGDATGALQQEVISAVSILPGFIFDPFQSTIEIVVTIDSLTTDHRDFQYQTDDLTGEIIDRLSPVESCHDAKIRFTVLKRSTKKELLDPIDIRQRIDFDFSDFRSYNDLAFTNTSGQKITTLSYSLGQLSAEDDAYKSAMKPLYQKIANKISSYLLINSEKL